MNRVLDVLTSVAATLARAGSGARVGALGRRFMELESEAFRIAD